MGPWIFLSFAITFEVAGTFFLKLSSGFERWPWGIASIACYSACFWMLAPAMKALPVGLVYAIWAGIGIVAASLIGLVAFGDRLSTFQIACIALILIGVLGLRLTNAS